MVDQAEIRRKVMSGEDEERRKALELFRDNFADLPDKEKAWKDLYWLTWDVDWYVRWHAADALGTAFQHVADKERAWKDLHRLTHDKDSDVRIGVTGALGTAFQHVPDKKQAWNDLIQLRRDKESYVRFGAADALGTAFQYVPDKERAWNDLIRLTQDEDSDVRWGTAGILGDTFPHVADKERAWKDLHRLTEAEDGNVRASANHSLGRASIFKATEAESEDDFKSELKNALEFFERSSNEATHFNPSRFCLPFYRSFYAITFGEAGAEDEVQKYLAEAKRASGGSKSKETLLEAIANLANALSEAHKVTDFGALKSDLNIYRRYCNRAGRGAGFRESMIRQKNSYRRFRRRQKRYAKRRGAQALRMNRSEWRLTSGPGNSRIVIIYGMNGLFPELLTFWESVVTIFQRARKSTRAIS